MVYSRARHQCVPLYIFPCKQNKTSFCQLLAAIQHFFISTLYFVLVHHSVLLLFTLQSKLEFLLRLQEFVELVKAKNFLQAISYARKYLAPWGSTHMKELQRVTATLVFRSSTNCAQYKVSSIVYVLLFCCACIRNMIAAGLRCWCLSIIGKLGSWYLADTVCFTRRSYLSKISGILL